MQKNDVFFSDFFNLFFLLFRYLKVKPESLKNKNMDCLIPNNMKFAHDKSCDIFVNSKLSPTLGDMIESYIKFPERDYILPVGYNIKIMPDTKNDFKYVVGVKYNRNDSNMYILLDESNQIDSFSYNMRYLFK